MSQTGKRLLFCTAFAYLLFQAPLSFGQAFTTNDGNPMTGTAGMSSAAASGSSSGDPTTPCDPQFMQALEARAWLEAQREVSQNENLIVKPDSVLEYSCFNQFLNKAASNWNGADGVNRQFSETDAWKTTGFNKQTTDLSLTQVVGVALYSYIGSNFPANYLGGRLDSPAKVSASSYAQVNGDAAFSCNLMAQIWEQARCQNFDQMIAQHKPSGADSNYNQDGFRDFAYYANEKNDPRVLPPTTNNVFHSCPDLDSGSKLQQVYSSYLDEAFNKNKDMFVLKNPDDDKDPDGTQYKTDDVKTYFDMILPGTCSQSAIPTGVKIYRSSGNTTAQTGSNASPSSSNPSDDKICPNPGCSWDGQSCSSGS